MLTTTYIVSDLHLGGAEGFRMCPAATVARLAALVDWARSQRTPERDAHLVLNGDVVDFLAERDADGRWTAFVADEEAAALKLDRVFEATAPFWDALRGYVSSGAALTLLVGNHDVELSLPRVRDRLLRRFAAGGGRVRFLHDNEAFTCGRLIVEHGNRYDGWNVVDHDALRRMRSALSRREPAQPFPVQPGSELVARIMNPIKERFAFVDLLKPETSAVAPILAVLEPGLWKLMGRFVRDAAAAANRARQLRPDGPSPGSGYVAARVDPAAPAPAAPPSADDEGLRLADALASPPLGAPEGKVGFWRDLQIDRLLQAFRHRREQDGTSFRVDAEAAPYLAAASALARRGFEVVVFGHTHHAKRVELESGGTYLNSGTWADLMRIPDVVYAGGEAAGEAALRAWLDDLEANRIDRYRRAVPTFVRVDVAEDGSIVGKDVLFFDGPDRVEPVTTERVLERLGI